MHLPLTYLLLAMLAAALLLLRRRWWALTRTARGLLLGAGVASIALRGLSMALRCSPASFRVDAALSWMCIAGYGLLLVRFSVMRPRWLVGPVSVVLALPVFAASILLPLTELFDRTPPTVVQMGNGLYSERRRIETSPVAVNGAEFDIYSRPAWAPFLRCRRETARLFDTQCDTSAMYAVLLPGNRTVRVTCPDWPGHTPAMDHSAVVPLR